MQVTTLVCNVTEQLILEVGERLESKVPLNCPVRWTFGMTKSLFKALLTLCQSEQIQGHLLD